MIEKYKISFLRYDLVGAISIAALSLPVGIAYAEMIGLPPESGIYTAVFSLICYFFLGASKDQIIGPDSITVALLASSVFSLSNASADAGFQFIFVTTIFSGLLFFLCGYLKLGFISNFLSKPILSGFLNGVAVVLLIGQITKFTGVPVKDGNSIAGVFEFLMNIKSIHIPTLVTGLASLTLILILTKASKKIPTQLVVILISIICTVIFQLKSYGLKFAPEILSSMPNLFIPEIGILKDYYSEILIDAAAIVFLTYTNTVVVGKSLAAGKEPYDSNKEFYAMGVTNIVSGFFRGIPASGTSSITQVNIDSGSKTKFSKVLAAVIMVLVMVLFPTQFALIPSAVFAAIIIKAAISIFDFKSLKQIRKFNREEFRIALICMAGVLAIGVLKGILIALVLSFLNLIKKSYQPVEFEMAYNPDDDTLHEKTKENDKLIDEEVLYYRFNSAMLFYNFEHFKEKLYTRIEEKKNIRYVLLDANPVNYIDVTFADDLVLLISELKDKNINFVVFNPNEWVQKKFSESLGNADMTSEIFYPDVKTAYWAMKKA
jgi:high affinity sulfate transporter 1